MKEKFPIAGCRLPIDFGDAAQPLENPERGLSQSAARGWRRRFGIAPDVQPGDVLRVGTTRAPVKIANRKSQIANGFTLVEVMVVVVLLSLIVFALMAVFNSTQAAFRASVTQAGVLDDGRAAIDLMAADLRAMAPSLGQSNFNTGAVNFYAGVTAFAAPPSPLIQPMVGGNNVRTNVLEYFFILSRGNQNGVPMWHGVGYAVATNAPEGSPYALYRFATNHPVAAVDPALVFARDFIGFLANITSGSHLMDGVVALTVRAYDVNGGPMTTNIVYSGGLSVTNQNVIYFPSGPPALGETGFFMFSNTLPASVQIEMGVLEDRALQRAESLSGSFQAQSNYLSGCAGQVHVFRQRVSIPNVDPAAYQ
ncbi:MAG: prepilin-type N-terminal cleavage/methylation domain-containing protein [Verrucomicrobiota bacterium]|jgi:prepilin-type N-terminal cleavage/methylation domain-containing protein